MLTEDLVFERCSFKYDVQSRIYSRIVQKPCKILLVQIYPVFVNCLFVNSLFIDWLIDRLLDFFIFLFFILAFIDHQTQTERRKITLESWVKLTYNPHIHFKSIDPITSEKTVSFSVPFPDAELVGAWDQVCANNRFSTGSSKSAGKDSAESFTSDEEERRGRNDNLASSPSSWLCGWASNFRPLNGA